MFWIFVSPCTLFANVYYVLERPTTTSNNCFPVILIFWVYTARRGVGGRTENLAFRKITKNPVEFICIINYNCCPRPLILSPQWKMQSCIGSRQRVVGLSIMGGGGGGTRNMNINVTTHSSQVSPLLRVLCKVRVEPSVETGTLSTLSSFSSWSVISSQHKKAQNIRKNTQSILD